VAIAGEGRIGALESALLPLNDGPAYFALRSRVPVVPIAINGTSWLRFGGRVRVRVGEPIVGSGRPDRAGVEAMTAALQASLAALVADAPEPERSGRSGGWLSERFNEWPEGSREAALAAQLAGAIEPQPLAAAGG
jgi:1-acyl-sn-glycerol-3-phosphate acyltransferase